MQRVEEGVVRIGKSYASREGFEVSESWEQSDYVPGAGYNATSAVSSR